jgi:hypothetical protein
MAAPSILMATQPAGRYAPTHFASPGGAGRHDGSRGNEWTLAEAYANAAAGNRVQFAPGTYVARSGRVRTQASTPRHNGTAQAPIVFFAQHPAVYHTNHPERHTIWVSDGAQTGTGSVTGHAENVSGGHYVVWDGISMRQVNGAWNSGELGVVSLFAGGSLNVKFHRCLFDQQGQGQLQPAFNWGAVFIQQTSAIEFADCIFQNIPGSHEDENAMPFVTYAAGELEVHHCEFRNNAGGSAFFKGVQSGSAYDNRPIRWHHCRHLGFTSLALCLGAVGQSDVQPGKFCDVFQNVWQPDPKGVGLTIWWRDVSGGRAPRNVRLVNNTFAGPIAFAGGEEAMHRVATIGDQDDIWRDSMFVNNIVQHTSSNVAYIGVQYGKSSPAGFKKLVSDYNCYAADFRHYAGMDLGAWRKLGQDVNSFFGAPRFRDAKSGDFRLEAASPIRATGANPGRDVLNLLGHGVAGKINRGAYITTDMSDVIGIRPEAVTNALPLVWTWPYA